MWAGGGFCAVRTGGLGRVLLQEGTGQALWKTSSWRHVRLQEGIPGGSDCKESACNSEDLGLIPGPGRSPGEGKGYPL